ncbi:MAG TPA: anthrone oxygenase family protein [Paucimonas sp.]|nr:anthrone oxygenase family protein [Paucimonas sp.]
MSRSSIRHGIACFLEIAAVLLLGLMAGFFFAFAVDVAPAMTRLDASAYITTQQWINRTVRNAVFGAAYFGSALLPFMAAAAVFHAGRRKRALLWLAIAVAYFVAVFWVTRAINVPINNELATWNAAAPPASWIQARDTWNQSNLVRTMAAAVCFLCAAVLSALKGEKPE